jgi:hypothetical protein
MTGLRGIFNKNMNICYFCKKKFNRTEHPERNHKFCSLDCYRKYRKISPQPQVCINALKTYLKKKGAKGKVKFTCEQCGKNFEEFYSNRRKGHIFCSANCSALWKSKNLVGINSPNYKNGNTPKINLRCNSSWWAKIRMEVYKRDNFTCQICGIKCTKKMDGTKIQCHHIENSNDHSYKNLLTVCLKCHTGLDFTRRRLAFL